MAFDYKKEYKEFYLSKDEPSISDPELYKRLAELTRSKELWRESIPYVASLLENQSPRITAKALWLIGEMEPCDFCFVRHRKGEVLERTKSV